MIYYHTQNQSNGRWVIWSNAKTLREAGKTLARHNEIWPDKSTDGTLITVGKRQRGSKDIVPTALYRLTGDKLVRESKLVMAFDGGIGFALKC